MSFFIYIEKKTGAPVKINAAKCPCDDHQTKSGTWVVNEWNGKSWTIGCFPEITLGGIKKYLKFVGKANP